MPSPSHELVWLDDASDDHLLKPLNLEPCLSQTAAKDVWQRGLFMCVAELIYAG